MLLDAAMQCEENRKGLAPLLTWTQWDQSAVCGQIDKQGLNVLMRKSRSCGLGSLLCIAYKEYVAEYGIVL